MTILSKKKVSPSKPDQENPESNVLHTNTLTTSHSNHAHQLSSATPPQGSEQLFNPGQLSPAHRWSPHRGEENPLSNENPHDNANRKRHRASPHRVVRTKRERNQPSPTSSTQGPSEAVSNPVPDPSGGPADPSGYNSGDEYNMEADAELTESHWLEKDRMFAKKMQKKGFVIKEMGRDGACLFRAVADQVYGDQEMHSAVRKHCMDYIERNRDHFSQYVTEDFNNEPIRLSYEQGCHYNSIVDPHKATVGVGLGLPGFKPGLADQNMMADALMQSENFEIEQAMLKDKIFASDLEATNLAIEEQVARASYMEWVRETEKHSKTKLTNSTASATVTSASSRSRSLGGSPVPLDNIRSSPRNSPKAGTSSASDYCDMYDMPGTSKASVSSSSASAEQYYFYEGPSTSSFQGNAAHTTQRGSWSSGSNSPNPTVSSSQPLLARSTATMSPGQRSPDSSTNPSSSKTADCNLRSRLHQLDLIL
ncbi:hypothetical protein B566_EDAN009823 [Ephemera danica]|nr:hypothetical protein B566_EDAN009823 [Ephemera danica]